MSSLGFKACKHEPCLYHNNNYKLTNVYFLIQVDDFAINSVDPNIAYKIIDRIDRHMTIKVKPLGFISRFNGVDIKQAREEIKLNNLTCINEILHDKKLEHMNIQTLPIPMTDNIEYNRNIKQHRN